MSTCQSSTRQIIVRVTSSWVENRSEKINKSILKLLRLLLRFQSETDRTTTSINDRTSSIVAATYPSYWPFCLRTRRFRDYTWNFSETGWSTCSAASDRDWPSPVWPFSNPCWPSRSPSGIDSRLYLRTGHVLEILAVVSPLALEAHQIIRSFETWNKHDRQHSTVGLGCTPKPWVPRSRLTVSPTVGRPAPPGWLNTLLLVQTSPLSRSPLLLLLATFSFSLPLLGPPTIAIKPSIAMTCLIVHVHEIVLVVVIHRRRCVGLHGVVGCPRR